MAGFVLISLSAAFAACLAGYFNLLRPRRPATAALTLLSFSLFVEICLELIHRPTGRDLGLALVAADILRLVALATILLISLRHQAEVYAGSSHVR